MQKLTKLLFALVLVLAVSTGCNDIQAPLAVVPATPTNGSTVSAQTLVLTWASLGNNTYEVQISQSATFQSLVVDATNVTSLIYPVTPGTLGDGNTYFWRVRAFRAGQSSQWSSASYFITSGSTPTPPVAPGTITVNAVLDGAAWTGNINYTVNGPAISSGYTAPQTFSGLPTSVYTLNYISGGPSGATMDGISPSSMQTLPVTGSISFTIRFRSQSAGGIQVFAQLDGAPWEGSLNYSVSGPNSELGYAVPHSFSNLNPGTYTITYIAGGPAGAVMTSVTPAQTQSLSSGAYTSFTLAFRSTSTGGTGYVSATLNGQPWSGSVNYTLAHYAISGPVEKTGYSVPSSISNLPAGVIQLNYNSGGPAGATLSSISPSAQQTLVQGGTAYYTLNFTQQQAYGSILVNATLDGSPWQTAPGSGPISYSVSGPTSMSGSSMPGSYGNQPTGSYTVNYLSGGPIGATYSGASPSITQTLTPGGTIVFTLNFHSQMKGTVYINATQNGVPWSGPVSYFVSGPYPQSGSGVPGSIANAPAGNYSISYSSGGPSGFVFEGVSPSTQYLSAGGSITFTIRFVYRGGLLQ